MNFAALSMRATLVGLLLAAFSVPALSADDEPAKKPPDKPRSRLTISKEVTFITEPLRDDGYPDYIAALNQHLSRGVTPQSNAVVALLRVMGPKMLEREGRGEFFKLLGIDELPETGEYFQTWEEFAETVPESKRPKPPRDWDGGQYFEKLVEEVACKKPWNERDFPHLAVWLKRNSKAIDRMAAATSLPHYYSPIVSTNEVPLIIAAQFYLYDYRRAAINTLAVRAMFRLKQHDIDGAWSDLLACRRLGWLVAHGPLITDVLVGWGAYYVAYEADRALFGHIRLTRAQAAKMRAQLDALPQFPTLAEKLNVGERYQYLDATAAVAVHGVDKVVGQRRPMGKPISGLVEKYGIDWDVPLKMGNEWFTRRALIQRINDRQEYQKQGQQFSDDWEALEAELKKPPSPLTVLTSPRKTLSRFVGAHMLSLFMGATHQAQLSAWRGETWRRMTRTCLALAEHRAVNGRYPETLDSLVPTYLDAVPIDANTLAPLTYKPKGGGYLLYVFGLDEEDDRAENDGDDADDWAIRVSVE